MKPNELTIGKVHTLVVDKEIFSVDLTRAVLDRIIDVDEKLGLYIR